MKIEYRQTPSADTYTVLADDASVTLADKISGFTIPFSKSPQVDALAGGVSPFIQDRGNAVWNLSFVVDRVHATQDAAALFISTHAAIFGSTITNFDLKVTIGAQVMYLVNAAITQYQPRPLSDKSSLIQYTFTAANWTNEAP